MKKKIYRGLFLLLCIFVTGSVIAMYYIVKTTHQMDKLLMLHQVEIQRENVIIHAQHVQSSIDRDTVRNSADLDLLIAHVQEMDKAIDGCMGCHHEPDLAQGLMGMNDLADDYKASISQLFTASADPRRIKIIEERTTELGSELISMAQGMAFMANIRLQKRTQETMAAVRKITIILISMLIIGIGLAITISFRLARSVEQPMRSLLDATRRIARGDLKHRVEMQGNDGEEFKELSESFNAMTQNLSRSQRQLVHSAKMAAIGELATNIAYEVNNPLTGVLGYTGLLLKSDDIPEDKKAFLKTMETEILRSREIIKNLLDFGRRKPPRLVKTTIGSILDGALSLVRSQARLNNVEITDDCPESLPAISVDPEELKQVFVNLMNNAFFAMQKGGTLSIRCRADKDLTGNEVIAVDIADTGPGIPETQLTKIFDPFFTSGASGEGTGLGLSISYMIVEHHGGNIEVESTIGKGSVFTVILPVS